MEEELIDAVPCSSLAVDAILRIGTVTKIYLRFRNINSIKVSPNACLLEYNIAFYFQAGAIWGLCAGPQLARKRGNNAYKIQIK